ARSLPSSRASECSTSARSMLARTESSTRWAIGSFGSSRCSTVDATSRTSWPGGFCADAERAVAPIRDQERRLPAPVLDRARRAGDELRVWYLERERQIVQALLRPAQKGSTIVLPRRPLPGRGTQPLRLDRLWDDADQLRR